MSSVVLEPRLRRWSPSWLLLVLSGALLLFGAVSSLGIAFAILGVLAIGVVLVWRRPAWAAVMLVALVPINRFLILLVFHYGHSSAITAVAQAWKDLLVVILTVRTVDDVVLKRRPKLHYVDVLVAALLIVSALYLIYPGNTGQLTFVDRLIGFRADTWFLLAYFVGRGLVLERRHVRALFTWLIPGTVLADIVAVAEFGAPNWFNHLFNKLGFAAFINTQSAFGDADVIRQRGIAGANLPRASSLLLGDLALAYFSVFALAVAAGLLFTARSRRARWGAGAFTVLAFIGMTLTITRSALIAATVMLVFMALVTRGWRFLIPVLAMLLAVGLATLASGLLPISAVGALTNSHEASIQAHGLAIQNAWTVLSQNPFGIGLGTTGTIGQRVFGTAAITTENWYLAIALELGAIPALLFIAVSTVVAIEAFLSFRRVRDLDLRRLSLGVLGASLGLFVLGNMLSVWEVPVLSMAFWLLAGVAVGARDVDADPLYQESR